jgi:hypothetical protein
MRRTDLTEAILGAQHQDGAFVSLVALDDGRLEDRNGFITALVVRAIGHGQQPLHLDWARTRALDFLERCERQADPGTFGFWPQRDRPSWAPDLPADVDDTAIIALELHRAGRRSLEWLRRVALTRLLPFRVLDDEPGPAWIRPGVFRTWLARGKPNPVDCVVNVNVAALLNVAGLTHVSAYSAVLSMIGAALEWTGDTMSRAALLAPFYADTIELYWALAHSVASGAHELQPSLDRVAGWLPRDGWYDPDRPVCRAAYGATVWRSPILQMLRRSGRPGLV